MLEYSKNLGKSPTVERYVEDESCLLAHIDFNFLQHVVNLSLQSGQPEVEGVVHSTSRQVAGGCNSLFIFRLMHCT